jgi:hypothetical protein
MSIILKPPTPMYSAPATLFASGGTLPGRQVIIAVNPFGSPIIASDQYYTAIRNQDYATAYTYLGVHLKMAYAQAAYKQAAMQRDATDGKVSHYSYITIPTGDPATAILTVTRTNEMTYTVHLELRQEGAAWKITVYDRI